MLRITDTPTQSLHDIPCVSVSPGGRGIAYNRLPISVARVRGLPESLGGLLVTSDLQAYDTDAVPAPRRRLIGHLLAEELDMMSQQGMIPDTLTMGAILAGDLFALAALDKRGGLGDVDRVWESFEARFKWVTGVGGNHDQFSGRCDFEDFPARANRYPLHGDVIELDGLKIGGISGVIGMSGKPWRIKPAAWKVLADRVLAQEPDILILHQGPANPDRKMKGHDLVNEVLESCSRPPLVIFGHCHWPEAVSSFGEGTQQLLNVDYRAVLLLSEDAPVVAV